MANQFYIHNVVAYGIALCWNPCCCTTDVVNQFSGSKEGGADLGCREFHYRPPAPPPYAMYGSEHTSTRSTVTAVARIGAHSVDALGPLDTARVYRTLVEICRKQSHILLAMIPIRVHPSRLWSH